MSIAEELTELDPDDSGAHKPASIVDELTGLDKDGEADKADEETRAQAREELGQEALVAVKGNDAKALYRAIADILANEG